MSERGEEGGSCKIKYVTCGACSNGKQSMGELNGMTGDLAGAGEL